MIFKRICSHCNKEFVVKNEHPNYKEKFTSTTPSCTHCSKTNNVWIDVDIE